MTKLFITWVIILGLMTSGVLIYEKIKKDQVVDTGSVTTPLPSTATSPTPTLTREEVLKHNSEQDCWLSITSQVYDITS